jgi:membrane-associated phospholipid phosphatase
MYRFYRLVSIVFHPVLLPVAATIAFFILNHSTIDSASQVKIILVVATVTYFIPILLLLVLKKKKLIDSFEVRKINERKIPVLFMTILFFILAKSLNKIPNLFFLSQLFVGCSIALSICYFLFLSKLKISLHLIGISSFIGFMMVYSLLTQTNLLLLITSLFLAAGFIAQARLKLKEHSLKEVLIGFLVGFLSQFSVFLSMFV